MPRRNFLLGLAYDGADFAGWQRGPKGQRTVQAEVEAALSTLLGEDLEIVGASRTDAGVHAEGQAASFHTRSPLEPDAIVVGLNRQLPHDVACRSCREVDPRFHARYRAKGKIYRYRLHTASLPDPFTRRYSLHVEEKLDMEAVGAAAALLSGSHDFRGFSNAKASEDWVRRLDEVRVEAWGEGIDFLFRGDGFLYNQVRIMAAVLLEAGRGRLDLDAIRVALEEGRRDTMPGALGPFGLCLVAVQY